MDNLIVSSDQIWPHPPPTLCDQVLTPTSYSEEENSDSGQVTLTETIQSIADITMSQLSLLEVDTSSQV